jgi:hypothetical protein
MLINHKLIQMNCESSLKNRPAIGTQGNLNRLPVEPINEVFILEFRT